MLSLNLVGNKLFANQSTMSLLVLLFQIAFISLAVSQPHQSENDLGGWRTIIGGDVIRRDDYTYTPGIGGHKLHVRAVPWTEARRTCADEGGHLAIINSVAEANVITALFRESGPFIGGADSQDWAFIGFHDLFQQGEYVTVLDQSLAKAGYTQWSNGEPTTQRNGQNENCGAVYRHGGLSDILCDIKEAFICELPIY